MFRYTPPINEMRFWMASLGGLEGLSIEGSVDPGLFDQILSESARFAETVLAPINALGDREGALLVSGGVRMPEAFKEAYAAFTEAGWCGLRAHEAWGGLNLPRYVATPVAEMWHSANLAFALCPLLTQSAIEMLERVASLDLQQRFLPKLVQGEWSGTMNLTEPDAGTDLSKIRTRALPYEDHYRIYGQKIFITYGDHDLSQNIIHLVLARLPDAPPGIKGLSLFLVPKIKVDLAGALTTPNDVRCISIEHKLGIHASPTCVMSYGDDEGAEGYLVGEPNRGLEHMFVMMNAARFSVGLQGVGLAERAYQQALHYAQWRVQGVPVGTSREEEVPIIDHPDVRRMIMRMRAMLNAGRALQYYTAIQMDLSRDKDAQGARDAAHRVDLLTPLIKAWNTEMAEEVSSIALQVHGGMGYIEDTGIAQVLRDARITTLYEGTTGIQAKDLLIRHVVKDDGQRLQSWLREWRDEIAADVRSPEVMRRVDECMGLIDLLVKKAQDPRDRRELYIAAVPFMRALGRVFGALLLLRVSARHERDPIPGMSLETLSAITTYFIEHVLPEADGAIFSIRAGAASAFALPREAF